LVHSLITPHQALGSNLGPLVLKCIAVMMC
jgi:hypothetical protein